jgi:hypothetical protein
VNVIREPVAPERTFEILQARRAEGILLLLESSMFPYGTSLPDWRAGPQRVMDAASHFLATSTHDQHPCW